VPAPPPILFTERHQPGIRFTERMTGWWSTPSDPIPQPKRRDYEREARRGRHRGQSLELVLTIEAQDLEATLRDTNHCFQFVGSATLGIPGAKTKQPFFARGVFRLFVSDRDEITSKQMTYRVRLTGPRGEQWSVSGFKALRRGGGFAGFHASSDRRLPSTSGSGLWSDQTRLYCEVSRLRLAGQPPLRGLGVLTLSASDFLRQLLTIRATKTTSRVETWDTIARFALFFGGVLRDTYGGPLARARYAPPDWFKRQRRGLQGIDSSRRVAVMTKDEVALGLTHYKPKNGRPDRHVILAPGFGVRADSFAIDTVKKNLVEYLALHGGYNVWLFDYRASPELDASEGEFTIDDIARYDWPAAIDTVLKEGPTPRVSVVAHCVGAMSFMMAALGGHLPAERIDTAILSQVAAHPIGAALNEVKAIARLGVVLGFFGQTRLQVTVQAADTYRRPVLDRWLKYYPTEDPCDNPVCSRVRFVFGESYLHENLDRPTHDAVIEMFGDPRKGKPAYASLRALRHLARIVRHEVLVHEDGVPYVTPKGVASLKKLSLKLCLMSGQLNAIFPKRGIETTQSYLRHHELPDLSEPIRLPAYAHMDCFIGARASDEVFPQILAELLKA